MLKQHSSIVITDRELINVIISYLQVVCTCVFIFDSSLIL